MIPELRTYLHYTGHVSLLDLNKSL